MTTRLRLIALDTAHWAALVTDKVHGTDDRRRTSIGFIPALLEQGWVPLLCWHHLEELIQHGDADLVDARLRYLRGIPHLAYIRPFLPGGGPGSVVDLLRAEVAVALSGEAELLRVRDGARQRAITFGDGQSVVPEELDGWRALRGVLEARQHGARRVAAIGRWRAADIDHLPLSTWLDQPLRNVEEVMPTLEHQRRALEREISTRGDKRIQDPAHMAAEFMSEVLHDGLAARRASGVNAVVQMLVDAGLDADDIDPAATFGATMDLLIFRNRLRVVADGLPLPWSELKRRVKPSQIPTTVLEDAMRRHAQDQPERKGSDLGDTHLLCLSAYADMTLVDKRTLENVRRLRSKNTPTQTLLGPVARASDYADIPALLEQL
jgi:hypothetical protein